MGVTGQEGLGVAVCGEGRKVQRCAARCCKAQQRAVRGGEGLGIVTVTCNKFSIILLVHRGIVFEQSVCGRARSALMNCIRRGPTRLRKAKPRAPPQVTCGKKARRDAPTIL